MFKLTRHFSIASAIAIFGVTLLLVVLFRQNSVEEVIRTTEMQNVSLAQSFANTIWPQFANFVTTVEKIDGDSLRAHPETSNMRETIRSLTHSLPVLKVKIYNLAGVTIYSSDQSQMGEVKTNNLGFMGAAKDGLAGSKLTFREAFSAFSGEVFDRHVVESYVPVRFLGSEPQGVIELYTDVTPSMDAIAARCQTVTGGLLIIFGILYGILYVVVRRGDGILKRQYVELRRSEDIEEKNSQLEIEIAERTRVEGELRENQHALTRLHAIASTHNSTGAQNIDDIIELGREIFGLPIGVVGRIDGDDYIVEHIRGPEGAPSVGTVFPIGDTYCYHALAADGPLGRHDVDNSELIGQPCYQTLGFKAYVGTPIDVDGKLFGTLCFADAEPRSTPFSDSEISLIQLLAVWVGSEIQRDKAQSALQESEIRFRAVAENAADALFVHDRSGRILEVNEQACRSLGYTRAELLSMLVTDIEEGRSADDLGGLWAALSDGKSLRTEGLHRRKDGSTFPIEVNLAMMDVDGRRNIVALGRDVAERKRVEEELIRARDEAEQANRAKSQFLAAASHDLRQPLQALTLFASALQETEEPARRSEITHRIRASLDDLGGLLNTLLDISKLEAGLVVPARQDFPVSEIFHLTEEFEPVAESNHVSLRAVRSSTFVNSDPILLESILRNLLSNAIKYSEGGKVLFGCRRRGDVLRFEVLDTGIGIAPEQQRLVFEEFYQVGNVARDREKGLGLGLSIVERTARLLDHKLEIRSVPGQGSVFALEVPIVVNLVDRKPKSDQNTKFKAAGKLVVAIDDEPAVLGGLTLLLESLGCDVVSGTFHGDPVDEISSIVEACPTQPAFIIVDYRLPGGITGVDVVRDLRAAFDENIPAVMLTGEISQDPLLFANQSGLTILHKPLNSDQLIAALNELLATVAMPDETSASPVSSNFSSRPRLAVVGGD